MEHAPGAGAPETPGDEHLLEIQQGERGDLFNHENLKVLLPLSIISVANGSLNNIAMQFVFPSFVELIGMTSPVVTMLAATFYQGVVFSPIAYTTLIPITAGGVLSTAGEVHFHVIGFALCVGSLLCGVARSVL